MTSEGTKPALYNLPLFKFFFLVVCLCLCIDICMLYVCVQHAPGSMSSDSVELELPVVVSCLIYVLGTELGSYCMCSIHSLN